MKTTISIQNDTLYLHRQSGSRRSSFETKLLPLDTIHIFFFDKTHLVIQHSKNSNGIWSIHPILKGTRYHTVKRTKNAIFSIDEEDEKIYRFRKEKLK